MGGEYVLINAYFAGVPLYVTVFRVNGGITEVLYVGVRTPEVLSYN